jgi:hypothetical protein
MSWNIDLIDNTVMVPAEFAEKLYEAADEYFMGDDCVLDEHGFLMFDDDAMEHKDYLHDDRILAVLKEAKVKGRIVFSDNEGDKRGTWWSYTFVDGDVTIKEGKIKDLLIP